MKNRLLIIVLALLAGPLSAQKIIEKKLPYKEGQTANLNLKFADSIQVRYWDKQEVYVKIRAVINNNQLNDALLVTDRATSDEVIVEVGFDDKLLRQGKAEDCPGNNRSSWNDKDGKQRYYLCKEINYQVFLPRNAKLKLETIDGNIDIQGATTTVHAKTISGFVDMSWPKSKGISVALKTITGEVYSDFDIDFKNKKEKNPIVGYLLEGTLNGGGPEVKLESISNDVYLRSKE
ncbi:MULTISPECIES: DUF4097 domain-containing protein [Dyadobacter]|uniref:DUF4097 domain-containing protein n=1 Tax=Dyadobacter chenhuakuii TaxID=2909339 RepID=A0ABY4XRN9_9BACT|nr:MULTISPECIES: DUF4097 domain-containing protein [Dyadobacter]MCF2492710.1 DUF4097 domain-containing protein [Dyadobacter chenhuakuii]MCF2520772.1 DUF4097 domain-containing protein [Dyadobacter sp. CY351]USJ32999.1 DUF4097 domain-containing protein [Dyadobacter chenhuakuii]